MKLKFKCSCGKVLVADVAAAGKKAKCPNCGQGVVVPKPTEAMLAAASDASPSNPANSGLPTSGAMKSAGELGLSGGKAKPIPPTAVAPIVRPTRPSPLPMAMDRDDLGLAPMDELALPAAIPPAKPLMAPPASRPPAASPLAPLVDSPLTPLDDGAGGAPQSIWDETADDDLRLSAVPEVVPCPQCGASMSPQAVVCMSCGYNRKTGTALAPAPAANKKSEAVEKLKSLFAGRGRSSSGGGFSRGTLRIVIIAAVGGIALLFFGYHEQKLASLASAEPETITLKKLLERGPNGNINLILTDYNICSSFIKQTKTIGGVPTGDWTLVWAPIVVSPPGALPPQVVQADVNLSVKAIIHSTHVANEQDLISKLAVGRLPGMVVNQVRSLNSTEKDILRKNYAGINFDSCIIFDEGRTPMSEAIIMLIFAGGAAALLVGIGAGVKGLLAR